MTLPAPDLSLPQPLAFWSSNLIGVPVAGLQICDVRICEVQIDQPITQEHPLPPLADDGRRA